MLLNEQCCSLLFQQCCSTNNVVHYCFNNVVQHWWSNNGCSRLLKQEKTILIEHACSLLLSWLNNFVDNIVHWVQHNIVHSWQHNIVHKMQHNIVHNWQQNIVHSWQHMYNTPVDNLQHVVRFYACSRPWLSCWRFTDILRTGMLKRKYKSILLIQSF